MSTHNLLRTTTLKVTRHYIDGRRVSREAFEEIKFNRRQDTFQTTVKRGVVRNYSVVHS